MKTNKIDIYSGNGRVIGPSIFSPRSGSIAIEGEDGEAVTLVPDHLILATGSRPRMLPGMEADGEFVLTSDDALLMEALPESMLIVGGGVIGVEWASMLNDFGVEVTIVEYAPRLVPTEDVEISKELERLFKKRGIKIYTGAKVFAETLTRGQDGVVIEAEQNENRISLKAQKMLVSVGRQANSDQLGLENTDVKISPAGTVQVNAFMQTAESHIYAIGDLIGGLQLAHAASHEGIVAVEHICGLKPQPYAAHLIPRCIYTRPEIASVGWTEQQAKELGLHMKTGKVQFRANGKALVYGEADGFAKVIADSKTQDILGVHLIGPHVTEHISEAALAQLLNATPWEVGQAIHPHPTLSESLHEAFIILQNEL